MKFVGSASLLQSQPNQASLLQQATWIRFFTGTENEKQNFEQGRVKDKICLEQPGTFHQH